MLRHINLIPGNGGLSWVTVAAWPAFFVRAGWGGVKRPSDLGESVLLKESVLPRERVLSWAMLAGWRGHGP